ncbi:uncharacterized protein LOC123541920 [Mercenaria mercenaria]|uniref:uncharacterized protein LOC123541920 n=1 Tax=Mercenaria mercenaria TaxID=6596 RepID=UPI00234F2B5E|nr:uncharacterized protein LOC123541920 [Mercenaria mercenaria]
MYGTLHSHSQQIIVPSRDSSGFTSARDEGSKRYGKIQDGLESSISVEGRARITRVLGEIHSLTDVEKLLLYLKLPTGVVQEDQSRLTPPSCLPTSNRKEQGEAFTWIKSHLEEHGDVCMPKAEVYDEYRQYCEHHDLRPLCNADFGKMMKQVFPDINTRRLGQRGQSKYFYGGLRKKIEHAPPTLPELEITTKTIEIDSNTIDSEMFKSSCQLVCEWADKLLDMKFSGIQEIAEHLIVKAFVNTKSVAAFTLIAAMQESGKYNLKDSALFSSQPNSGGDKHKETNILLQRKLQQNKEIQKQKVKAQALREEIQQQIVSHGNNSSNMPGSKTPVSSQRKSATPLSTSGSAVQLKSPRNPGPLSSPAPSPQKFQSPRKSVSPWQQQKTIESHGKGSVTVSQSNVENEVSVCVTVHDVANVRNAKSAYTMKSHDGWKNDQQQNVEKPLARSQLSKERESVSLVNEKEEECDEDFDGYKPMSTESICEAKTPENCMETDQSELTHVRKIDFDDLVAQHSGDNKSQYNINTVSEKVNNDNTKSSVSTDVTESSADKLSKSTGYLSLKKMLENKSEDPSGLNKSLGHLGKSKTALFVNQSTVPGRSAFVPFSQVQSLCRKEGSGINQSVAMAIPIIIPSAAQTQTSQTVSQSASITMIALPTDMQTSPTKNPSEMINNESLFNIVPASAIFKQASSTGSTELTFKTSTIDSSRSTINILNQARDGTNVTVSSVMSKTTGSECIVSVAQGMQNLPKQLRTKFTPIRPKASPNKAQPQKETKADIPTYDKDKRPVSAILKEKRAKEQAEAIAKFQSSIRLPYQQNISLSGQTLSTLQGIKAGSSNIPASEVVIIVNNQQVKLQQVVGQQCVADNPSLTSKMSISDKDHRNSTADSMGMNQIDKAKTSSGMNTAPSENLMNQSQNSNMTYISFSDSKNGKEDNEFGLADKGSTEVKEFSPMSEDRDITPILCEEDDSNDLSENLTRSAADLNKTDRNNQSKVSEMDANKNVNITTDIVDQMWLETPRKIQKLNITSPFQEDSMVLLGRETPVRISQPPDLSLNRPESAGSYGRETPSGARKRKSSDFHARQNFKRLNSTGEENEDSHNVSFVLSPDSEPSVSMNPRRTQSCTVELDSETKVKYHPQQIHQQQVQQQQQPLKAGGGSLLPGLQSPDIHSLEREALIESFPNSLYAMKPQHKSHKNQSSSVGVSAKTLRQSQQKLIKQQQYLDERVKNFLLTQAEPSFAVEIESNESVTKTTDEQKTGQISPGSKASLKAESFVVTDRGKPYQRPSSVATVSSRSSNQEIEPSGLPSEVADWINETIEKRQKENQSVMSEPEFRNYQSMKADRNPKLLNFKFEVDNSIQSGNKTSVTSRSQSKNAKEISNSKTLRDLSNDDSNFTVPKAPPVSNTRLKDTLRLNTEISSVSQRCQSLPIFASPVQSPVSPMAPPVGHIHSNQRASSMSPRAQVTDQSAEMLSPTSFGILSPVRRREMRDAGHRESKQGTYLASIQHSLQKPVDTPHDVISPQDTSFGKHPLAGGKSILQNRSRESSIDADDRFVSKTPFSDSGYHSSGPSPILNSTPVSVADHSDLVYGQGRGHMTYKPSIAESPITMVTDYTSPVQQLSPQQSPNRPQLTVHQQNVSIATSQMNNLGMNPNQLRSSIHSAFIPIQGSHHDVRYVTPIKPVVTLPNNSVEQSPGSKDSTGALFVDANQPIAGADITMISPRSADPPSYEVAIKHLKKSSPPKDGTINQSHSSEMLNKIDPIQEQIPQLDQQQSLLANMGNEQTSDSLGPFAQKLMKLSQQTQGGGKGLRTLFRSEILSSANQVSLVTNAGSEMIPVETDLSNVSATVNNCQSNISTSDIDHNGATVDFNFSGDVNMYANNQLMKKNLFDQRQTNCVLKQNRVHKSVLSNTYPEHSMLISNPVSDTVLNIDPSFHASSHFGTANQEKALSSLHNHQSANLNLNESSQLLNKPDFSLPTSDFNETQRFQVTSTEMGLFNNNGAFNRGENTSTLKNLLIEGKLANEELEMVVENGQNKSEEISQQELIDDIGLPWESLREIEGDFGDFNMF